MEHSNSVFMLPEPDESIPGPVMMNGDETCHVLAAGGGN